MKVYAYLQTVMVTALEILSYPYDYRHRNFDTWHSWQRYVFPQISESRTLQIFLHWWIQGYDLSIWWNTHTKKKKGQKNTLPYNQVHIILKCWTACYPWTWESSGMFICCLNCATSCILRMIKKAIILIHIILPLAHTISNYCYINDTHFSADCNF